MKFLFRSILLACTFALCVGLVFAKKGKYKNPNREELEKQRVNILAEIQQTEAQLGNLQKDKTLNMAQLLALQSKLDARKALVGNINKDLKYLEVNINSTKEEVQKLGGNLVRLKKQYAELVRFSYKQRVSQSLLMFFFSSKSFNDAIRRYQYIKQYKEYRKQQSDQIRLTSNELQLKALELNSQKEDKDAILTEQQKQEQQIANETNLKNNAVLQLKGLEEALIKKLGAKKTIAASLDNAISSAIRREIELARRKADMERIKAAKAEAILAKQKQKEEEAERKRILDEERKEIADANKNITAIKKTGTKLLPKNNTKAGPKPKTIGGLTETKAPNIPSEPKVTASLPRTNPRYTAKANTPKPPENPKPIAITSKPIPANDISTTGNTSYANSLANNVRSLSAEFENRKGNLPNPVSGGYICERFGKVKHPIYNVYTENFGVDIKSSKGATAKSIFAGEVSSVFTLPGTGTNILVNHGTYFTVYSKLENVIVKKGQQITIGQALGMVRTNEEGSTQMHLEIWKVSPNGTPVKLNPEQWIR